jgi:hypothetical protein
MRPRSSETSIVFQRLMRRYIPDEIFKLVVFLPFMCSDLLYIIKVTLMDLNTATGYKLDDLGVGVRVPVGARIFSSPRRPDRLWGPPSLLSNGYWGRFPQG